LWQAQADRKDRLSHFNILLCEPGIIEGDVQRWNTRHVADIFSQTVPSVSPVRDSNGSALLLNIF
jgi:hypothetical protein